MDQRAACALAVVVVTHNSARWVEGFFESWDNVLQQTPALRETTRIVVVDSGSKDDTLNAVQENAPQAQVIACGNIGYGAAANRGAKAAEKMGAAWLMVCNMDLTLSPEVGGLLQRVLAGNTLPENVWCVAPALLNDDGTTQASVGRWPTLCGTIFDQFRPREKRKYVWPQPTEARPVPWVTGACLILRRDAFFALGGFDENYFLYVEEVDLLRRGWQRGWKTWFEPGLKVVHHAPNANRNPRPEVQRWAARGQLRYFAKFAGWLTLRGYGLIAVLSRRLPAGEAFASRAAILARPTGP